MPKASSSKKPYLLRAMHEWMLDNGMTPHIVVEAGQEGVVVPSEHVHEGRIILNLSQSATRDLDLGNEMLRLEARFAGVPRRLEVPVAAVLGIYARETGEGMVFAEDREEPGAASAESRPSPPRPDLKIVK
jgi:stringent starvation protein B